MVKLLFVTKYVKITGTKQKTLQTEGNNFFIRWDLGMSNRLCTEHNQMILYSATLRMYTFNVKFSYQQANYILIHFCCFRPEALFIPTDRYAQSAIITDFSDNADNTALRLEWAWDISRHFATFIRPDQNEGDGPVCVQLRPCRLLAKAECNTIYHCCTDDALISLFCRQWQV